MTTTATTISITPGDRLYVTHVHYDHPGHPEGYGLLLSMHSLAGEITGQVTLVFPAAAARKHLAAIRDACDAAEHYAAALAAEHAETVLDRADLAGGAA